MRIQGDNIYLKMLERKDCKTLWNDYEYDFKNPTEEFNIGHSDEKAEKCLMRFKIYREIQM